MAVNAEEFDAWDRYENWSSANDSQADDHART